jgi:hypothetical protein
LRQFLASTGSDERESCTTSRARRSELSRHPRGVEQHAIQLVFALSSASVTGAPRTRFLLDDAREARGYVCELYKRTSVAQLAHPEKLRRFAASMTSQKSPCRGSHSPSS